MSEKKDYGKVTIGYGTPNQKELSVLEFFQTTYADNRNISIAKLEDDTLFLTVENPKSSGRQPQSVVRLSKESFVGLIVTIQIYANSIGLDMKAEIEKHMNGETIGYSHSDNITIKL
jgi:hypothetical protein